MSTRPRFVLRSTALLLGAVLLSLILVTCSPTRSSRTERLPVTVPWPDQEESRYILYEREREIGRGLLRIRRDGESYRLEQEFRQGANSDQSLVIVDPSSLRPRSSQRVITNQDPQTARATYTGATVRIMINRAGRVQERELQLPENAYDNDTSLFLWRALPFDVGYGATYTSVVALTASRPVVSVRVLRRETIDVPAGQFETWRVEIEAGRSRQTAWYSTDVRHHLVKYDNGRVVFVLERFSS